MGQDARARWARIQEIERGLRASESACWEKYAATGDIDDLQGQTERGAKFITSVENYNLGAEWKANVVCGIFNLSIVATRIYEGSHRVSSASEVSEFKSRTKREYAAHVALENARSGRSTVFVEALEPSRKGK